jgi:hypothetical protein
MNPPSVGRTIAPFQIWNTMAVRSAQGMQRTGRSAVRMEYARRSGYS